MIQTIDFNSCTNEQKDDAFKAIFSVNGDKIAVKTKGAVNQQIIRRHIIWNFLKRKDV